MTRKAILFPEYVSQDYIINLRILKTSHSHSSLLESEIVAYLYLLMSSTVVVTFKNTH